MTIKLKQDVEAMICQKLTMILKEKLIEKIKPLLEQTIKELTGAEVIDIHSSFNPDTGERIEIFTLNQDLKGAF